MNVDLTDLVDCISLESLEEDLSLVLQNGEQQIINGLNQISLSRDTSLVARDAFDEDQSDANTPRNNDNNIANIQMQQDIHKWNWQKDGTKRIGDGKDTIKEYFRCSNWNKPTVEEGCRARYTREKHPGEIESDSVWNGTLHNHEPPQKVRLDAKIRKDCKEMLRVGSKPGKIHEEHVRQDKEHSSRNTPSRKQLYNMNSYLKRSFMPTADVLKNITTLYGGGKFVHKIELLPATIFIFATAMGLSLLKDYGKTLLVDGTFDICEEELILTTLMVMVNGLGIPVCWVLSNKKDKQTYLNSFSFIKHLSENRLDPHHILCDFEDALRNSLAEVFPRALIYGDAFHVIQDNIKWLKRHGLAESSKELVTTLRMLWASPRVTDFQRNYKVFTNHWGQKQAPYVAYFNKVWIGRYSPVSWAYFGRGNHTVSGDQMLEAWHNRLQNFVVSRPHEAIDYVAKMLWDEATYHENILKSPYLLSERMKELETSKKKSEKRIRLNDYVAAQQESLATDNNNTSTLVLTDGTQIELLTENVEQDTAENSVQSMVTQEVVRTGLIAEPVHEVNEPQPSSEPSSSNSASQTLVCITGDPSESKCICGKLKNVQCSLQRCLACCAKSHQPCHVQSHKLKKAELCPNPFVQVLDQAMGKKKLLWMKYNGGSTPHEIRVVEPQAWKKKPTHFTALCQRSAIVKNYRVDRIEILSETPIDNIIS